MTFRKKKRLFWFLLLLITVAAFVVYKKKDSITWRFKMYTQTDITRSSVSLADSLAETSGLIWWNGTLWTVMDQAVKKIYAIDTATGKVVRSVRIANVLNDDWEEIAQDDRHIYIGDFGDNGNRPRIRPKNIYMVRKDSVLLRDTVTADTISFVLEGYKNDRHGQENNTDFDCEAMIAYGDSIYLFSKQWHNEKTTVYVLPKLPGEYVARKKRVHNIGALITGATYYPPANLVALTGYHTDMRSYLTPFVYLLTDFKDDDFFSGNTKKIYLGKPFHQVEAVATRDGKTFYFTGERLMRKGIGIPATLMRAELLK